MKLLTYRFRGTAQLDQYTQDTFDLSITAHSLENALMQFHSWAGGRFVNFKDVHLRRGPELTVSVVGDAVGTASANYLKS